MVTNHHCSVCDGETEVNIIEKQKSIEHNEEISFAALLALVPAMTMTLFNLMGLI